MGELFRVSYKHIVILLFPFLLIGLLYEIEDWLLNIGVLNTKDLGFVGSEAHLTTPVNIHELLPRRGPSLL